MKRIGAAGLAFALVLAPVASAQGVTDNAALIAGADWLLTQQFETGAYPWAVGEGPRSDSQGATARGMLVAYDATRDQRYLDSAVRTGDYLVDSYPRLFTDGDPDIFPFDPLFLEELSRITGDPRYADFVRVNLWDKLEAAAYGENNDQDAAAWAANIPEFPEFATWPGLDPAFRGSPAINAHLLGRTATRDALMASLLAELEQVSSAAPAADLTGLAIAIWASAVTGIDLDPQAGRWATQNSTQDLVDFLVSYQRPGGDWPYDTGTKAATRPGDTSVTSWAVIALKAWDGQLYASRIASGLTFVKSLQQPNGQILTNPGNPPTTRTGVEVHAEALIALGSDDGVLLNDVNQAPTAVADSATTPRDTAVTITVLANDSDADGSLVPATVTVTSGPAQGTASPATNGTVTYVPAPGFVGSDSFTYTVADDEGAVSNAATVTVTVQADNAPPTAVGDSASTPANTAVTVDVLANDFDSDGTLMPATVAVFTAPANGTATANANGTVTYTPAAGYSGADSFGYRVADDGGALSNVATVSLTVTPPPPPVFTTVTPAADAYISQAEPSSNFGGVNELRFRRRNLQSYISYLKFNVSGLTGAIRSVRLRFFVVAGSNESGTLYRSSNTYAGSSTPWTETDITWNNADRGGTTIATSSPLVSGSWVEFNVASTVTAAGTYSFAFVNATTALGNFSSREGANPPQLVVETQP